MVLERRAVMMQLVAMVICVSLPMTWAGLERVCTSEQSQYQSKHLCGANLANVIRIMCRFEQQLGKRSSDAAVKAITQEVATPMASHMSPFMDKAQAMAYLYKRSYSSGDFHTGVVCECCYHSCSAMELSQYCNNDKRSFAPASPMHKRFVGLMATAPQNLRPSSGRLGHKNSAVDLSYIQAAAMGGQPRVFRHEKNSYRVVQEGTGKQQQKLSRDDLRDVDHQDNIDDPSILFSKDTYQI